MAKKLKNLSDTFDFKTIWTPNALYSKYNSFPKGYQKNSIKGFMQYKGCRQLYAYGLYEESIFQTLKQCAIKNPLAVGRHPRGAKGYLGDEAYGLNNFKYLKKMKDGTTREKQPLNKNDEVPRQAQSGISILRSREYDVRDPSGKSTWGVGTFDGVDALVVIARNEVFNIKKSHALKKIFEIAMTFAMSKVAAFDANSSQATNLLTNWTSECNSFASFK
tara:strand:+ start:839 stop:1495 length:657 start_codon:yes stop_codon:yes gene_type:complete